jgi:hypothetical protein
MNYQNQAKIFLCSNENHSIRCTIGTHSLRCLHILNLESHQFQHSSVLIQILSKLLSNWPFTTYFYLNKKFLSTLHNKASVDCYIKYLIFSYFKLIYFYIKYIISYYI